MPELPLIRPPRTVAGDAAVPDCFVTLRPSERAHKPEDPHAVPFTTARLALAVVRLCRSEELMFGRFLAQFAVDVVGRERCKYLRLPTAYPEAGGLPRPWTF